MKLIKHIIITAICAVMLTGVVAPFARADGEIPAPFGLEWGMTPQEARNLGVSFEKELFYNKGASRGNFTDTHIAECDKKGKRRFYFGMGVEFYSTKLRKRFVYYPVVCRAKTLPKGISDAESYLLTFGEKEGLARVEVSGRKFWSWGKAVERYEELSALLTDKYGKPYSTSDKKDHITFQSAEWFWLHTNGVNISLWVNGSGEEFKWHLEYSRPHILRKIAARKHADAEKKKETNNAADKEAL